MIEDDAHAEPLVVEQRAKEISRDGCTTCGGFGYITCIPRDGGDNYAALCGNCLSAFERDLRPALPDMAGLVARLRTGVLIAVGEQPGGVLVHPDGTKQSFGPSTIETRQQCPLCIEAADAITKLSADYARIREALGWFLTDERFQVAVGGNPNVVERMLDDARAVLAQEPTNAE